MDPPIEIKALPIKKRTLSDSSADSLIWDSYSPDVVFDRYVRLVPELLGPINTGKSIDGSLHKINVKDVIWADGSNFVDPVYYHDCSDHGSCDSDQETVYESINSTVYYSFDDSLSDFEFDSHESNLAPTLEIEAEKEPVLRQKQSRKWYGRSGSGYIDLEDIDFFKTLQFWKNVVSGSSNPDWERKDVAVQPSGEQGKPTGVAVSGDVSITTIATTSRDESDLVSWWNTWVIEDTSSKSSSESSEPKLQKDTCKNRKVFVDRATQTVLQASTTCSKVSSLPEISPRQSFLNWLQTVENSQYETIGSRFIEPKHTTDDNNDRVVTSSEDRGSSCEDERAVRCRSAPHTESSTAVVSRLRNTKYGTFHPVKSEKSPLNIRNPFMTGTTTPVHTTSEILIRPDPVCEELAHETLSLHHSQSLSNISIAVRNSSLKCEHQKNGEIQNNQPPTMYIESETVESSSKMSNMDLPEPSDEQFCSIAGATSAEVISRASSHTFKVPHVELIGSVASCSKTEQESSTSADTTSAEVISRTSPHAFSKVPHVELIGSVASCSKTEQESSTSADTTSAEVISRASPHAFSEVPHVESIGSVASGSKTEPESSAFADRIIGEISASTQATGLVNAVLMKSMELIKQLDTIQNGPHISCPTFKSSASPTPDENMYENLHETDIENTDILSPLTICDIVRENQAEMSLVMEDMEGVTDGNSDNDSHGTYVIGPSESGFENSMWPVSTLSDVSLENVDVTEVRKCPRRLSDYCDKLCAKVIKTGTKSAADIMDYADRLSNDIIRQNIHDNFSNGRHLNDKKNFTNLDEGDFYRTCNSLAIHPRGTANEILSCTQGKFSVQSKGPCKSIEDNKNLSPNGQDREVEEKSPKHVSVDELDTVGTEADVNSIKPTDGWAAQVNLNECKKEIGQYVHVAERPINQSSYPKENNDRLLVDLEVEVEGKNANCPALTNDTSVLSDDSTNSDEQINLEGNGRTAIYTKPVSSQTHSHQVPKDEMTSSWTNSLSEPIAVVKSMNSDLGVDYDEPSSNVPVTKDEPENSEVDIPEHTVCEGHQSESLEKKPAVCTQGGLTTIYFKSVSVSHHMQEEHDHPSTKTRACFEHDDNEQSFVVATVSAHSCNLDNKSANPQYTIVDTNLETDFTPVLQEEGISLNPQEFHTIENGLDVIDTSDDMISAQTYTTHLNIDFNTSEDCCELVTLQKQSNADDTPVKRSESYTILGTNAVGIGVESINNDEGNYSKELENVVAHNVDGKNSKMTGTDEPEPVIRMGCNQNELEQVYFESIATEVAEKEEVEPVAGHERHTVYFASPCDSSRSSSFDDLLLKTSTSSSHSSLDEQVKKEVRNLATLFREEFGSDISIKNSGLEMSQVGTPDKPVKTDSHGSLKVELSQDRLVHHSPERRNSNDSNGEEFKFECRTDGDSKSSSPAGRETVHHTNSRTILIFSPSSSKGTINHTVQQSSLKESSFERLTTVPLHETPRDNKSLRENVTNADMHDKMDHSLCRQQSWQTMSENTMTTQTSSTETYPSLDLIKSRQSWELNNFDADESPQEIGASANFGLDLVQTDITDLKTTAKSHEQIESDGVSNYAKKLGEDSERYASSNPIVDKQAKLPISCLSPTACNTRKTIRAAAKVSKGKSEKNRAHNPSAQVYLTTRSRGSALDSPASDASHIKSYARETSASRARAVGPKQQAKVKPSAFGRSFEKDTVKGTMLTKKTPASKIDRTTRKSAFSSARKAASGKEATKPKAPAKDSDSKKKSDRPRLRNIPFLSRKSSTKVAETHGISSDTKSPTKSLGRPLLKNKPTATAKTHSLVSEKKQGDQGMTSVKSSGSSDSANSFEKIDDRKKRFKTILRQFKIGLTEKK